MASSNPENSLPKIPEDTLGERLDAMPLEQFEDFLKKVVAGAGVGDENEEILKQLKGSSPEHDKTEAEELVKSSKYSSSLQSLNPCEDLNANPVKVPFSSPKSPAVDKNITIKQNHHSTTLTTINSNSSLNSLGVEAGAVASASEPPTIPEFPGSRVNGGYPVATSATLRHCDEAIERLERKAYGRTYNTMPKMPSIRSRHHSGNGQPPVYFFNERETELPNGYKGGYLEQSPDRPSGISPICGGPFRRNLGLESLDNHYNPLHHSNPNNSIQLPEEYNSVACLTSGGSSAPSLISPSLRNPTPSSSCNSDVIRSMTPNFTLPPVMPIIKSSSEGSNADRNYRPRGLPLKKQKNKNSQRDNLVDLKTLPGFRGDDNVDNLVQFVEGMDSSNTGKKKGKKDKKEKTRKDKDTLVKSASLDENHLNYNTKRVTPDPQGGPSNPLSTNPAKGLKDLEKKSEKAVSANSIIPSASNPEKNEVPSAGGKNTASVTFESATEVKPKGKETELPLRKASPVAYSRESFSGGEERKDDSSEEPFKMVKTKKAKRNQKPKTKTQREAETFSRGKAREDSRREGGSRSRRSGGRDRRNSVGSVPGSDVSDQSDDDSVRSLPAGECTPKEHVPKQCASSGGTPQTSYADIARMTDGHKTSLPVRPPAPAHPLSIDAEFKTALSSPAPSPKPLPPKWVETTSAPTGTTWAKPIVSTCPKPTVTTCPKPAVPTYTKAIVSTCPNTPSTTCSKPVMTCPKAIESTCPNTPATTCSKPVTTCHNINTPATTCSRTEVTTCPRTPVSTCSRPVTTCPNTPVTTCSKATSTESPPPPKPMTGIDKSGLKTPLSIPVSVAVQTSPTISDPKFAQVAECTSRVPVPPATEEKPVKREKEHFFAIDAPEVIYLPPYEDFPPEELNANYNQKPSHSDGIKVSISDKTEFPDIAASNSVNYNHYYNQNYNHRPHVALKRNYNQNLNYTTTNANPNNWSTGPERKPEKIPSSQNNNSATAKKEVWKMIHNHNNENLPVARVPRKPVIVRPVFLQTANESPEKNNGHQGQQERNEPVPLANGDHYEGQGEEFGDDTRRRRNSTSTSSAGGDVAVVFCGGNFERQMAGSQDIGFEFGFNVMNAMSSNYSQDPEKCEEEVARLPPNWEQLPIPPPVLEPQPEAEPVENLVQPETVCESSEAYQDQQEPSHHPVPESEYSSPSKGGYRSQYQHHRESLLGNYQGPNPNSQYQENRRGSLPPYRTPRYRGHQRNGGTTYYGGGSGSGGGSHNTQQYTHTATQYQSPPPPAPAAPPPAPPPTPQYLPPPMTPLPAQPQYIIPPPPISVAHVPTSQYISVPPSLAMAPGLYQPPTPRTATTAYVIPPPVMFMPPHMPVAPEPLPMPPTLPLPGPGPMPIVYYAADGTPLTYPPPSAIPSYAPYYYYTPPLNYAVPVPPVETESWMNNCVQRTYTQGDQADMYHIE